MESSGYSPVDVPPRVGYKRINSRAKKDLISALPDSIIQHILSFLPSTKEAIQTSILSKRWRNQWTHVPVLIFNASRISGENFGFIENALILHDSPKIKKFYLHYNYGCKLDPRFTSKIRFAIRKCVEELILIVGSVRNSYLLPEFLFDSASLVKLEMDNCYFMPNWRVNWPSLKSLKLDCDSLNDNKCVQGIENVVSGSPLLERLEISGRIEEDHVGIVSKSLKVLAFDGFEAFGVIKIRCPNLVDLNINRSTFPDQMIEDALLHCPFIHSLKLANCHSHHLDEKIVISSKSLKELHLDYVMIYEIEVSCPNLEKLDLVCRGDNIFKAVNIPSSVCATVDYIHPADFTEKELLEQFQHVNNLTLERSCFWFISDAYVEHLQLLQSLPLLNCKCLTLNVGFHFGLALPGIAHALHSPSLEMLVINLDLEFLEDTSESRLQELIISRLDYWNFNRFTGLTCLVSHLKTIKIIGLYENDDKYCKHVLEFIEFLLKNARVLEKMTVLLDKTGKDFVIKVSQKLLSFPRCSQLANVELVCAT